MKALGFDVRGNLLPADLIEIAFEELEKIFVEGERESVTRKELFEHYREYLIRLSELLEYPFFQWLDGSFISRKMNPRDIDLISGISYRDYQKNVRIFEKEFISFEVRKKYGIDAYIVPIYPEGHPKRMITESDLLYWRNLFGKTKVNRAGKQFKKGFVQINFSHDSGE